MSDAASPAPETTRTAEQIKAEHARKIGERQDFGVFAAALFVLWLIPVAVLPFIPVSQLEETSSRVTALSLAATSRFGVDVRLELRRGSNIRIYISRQQYESIPYPDRAAVIDEIGYAWFSQTGFMASLFVPSVYIRDVHTGEQLDSRNSLWMWIKKVIGSASRAPSSALVMALLVWISLHLVTSFLYRRDE